MGYSYVCSITEGKHVIYIDQIHNLRANTAAALGPKRENSTRSSREAGA